MVENNSRFSDPERPGLRDAEPGTLTERMSNRVVARKKHRAWR
jgi:hypothetical protein